MGDVFRHGSVSCTYPREYFHFAMFFGLKKKGNRQNLSFRTHFTVEVQLLQTKILEMHFHFLKLNVAGKMKTSPNISLMIKTETNFWKISAPSGVALTKMLF